MIRDILCVAAVGIGSGLLGWSIGASKKCPDCPWWYDPTNYDYVEYDEEDDISSIGDVKTTDVMNLDEYAKQYEAYKNAVSEYNQDEPASRHEPVRSNRLGDDIFIISYEQWSEADEDEYIKDTLVYYTDGEVVCDMKEDKIVEYQELVGSGAVNSFGVGSHDPDVVYIRNERMKHDFEFVRQHSSYEAEVLGLSEDVVETADAKVQEALEYFGARSVEDIDPSALAKYHIEREDE